LPYRAALRCAVGNGRHVRAAEAIEEAGEVFGVDVGVTIEPGVEALGAIPGSLNSSSMRAEPLSWW
jgi:hypothetical protein